MKPKGPRAFFSGRFVVAGILIQIDAGYILHFSPRSEGFPRQDMGDSACEEFGCLHHHF